MALGALEMRREATSKNQRAIAEDALNEILHEFGPGFLRDAANIIFDDGP